MKITLVQNDLVWEDKQANLKNAEQIIESIKEPTDLIVLPEMFSTGFTVNPASFAEAENGETLSKLQSWAKRKEAAIITSFIVKDEGNYFNRAFFIFPDGTYRTYNKRHLFRMGGEDKRYTMGQDRTIVQYKGFRIMLQICYDLRFPVWARNRNDYDLLVYIANWPASRAEAWKTLLKARAIENQSYLVGVNRIGEDGNGLAHSGNSALINFKGEEESQFEPNKEQYLTYTISKTEQDEFRQKFPTFLDADNFEVL